MVEFDNTGDWLLPCTFQGDKECPGRQGMHEKPISDANAPADGLAVCEERIGYSFRNRHLLEAAVTHASGAAHRLASNERLEFLGDSILGFVVCNRLYNEFPELLEGDLTRIKSAVVSRETCSRISIELGLIDFLVVGKGMAVNRPVPNSVLSDMFESLVAAIFLDGGIDPARTFLNTWIGPEIEKVVSGEEGSNYKSLLQQLAQGAYGIAPTYEVIDEVGPDHNKEFQVRARIGQRRYAPAWGRNKKEAEQGAAEKALENLRLDGVISSIEHVFRGSSEAGPH